MLKIRFEGVRTDSLLIFLGLGVLGWGIVRPNSDVGFDRDYRDGLGNWVVACRLLG